MDSAGYQKILPLQHKLAGKRTKLVIYIMNDINIDRLNNVNFEVNYKYEYGYIYSYKYSRIKTRIESYIPRRCGMAIN